MLSENINYAFDIFYAPGNVFNSSLILSIFSQIFDSIILIKILQHEVIWQQQILFQD